MFNLPSYFKKRTLFLQQGFFLIILMLFFGLSAHSAQAAAPVISGVSISNITAQGATVTWTTDTASGSLVDFGLTTSYGTTLGDPAERVTSHAVVLTGLTPLTLHHFRVRSINAAGQETIQAGFTVTTTAAPIISDVYLESVSDNQATFTFRTDIPAYPWIAYGLTDAYGLVVGDESNFSTTHSVTLFGLTPGRQYYYRPRVSDIYGNYTFYSQNGLFTTSAPYLESFSTTKSNGTYGPGTQIPIIATYQENVTAGSSVTVTLNTGVEITLNQISGNTISGLYVVGATGSGQNSSSVFISSISYQNVCDSDGFCYRGVTLPVTNVNTASSLTIDTTAPVFSNVSPVNTWPNAFNNITTSSDIGYTLSEVLGSGKITFLRTSGSLDAGAPHVCTLTGTALTFGLHSPFNLTNCQEGLPTLVNGTVYTIRFEGTDSYGNNATQVNQPNMRFDTAVPVLQSFTSSTPNGTYGVASAITIIANFNEEVRGSMRVILDTGVEVLLSYNSTEGVIKGTYTVGSASSGQASSDLNVTQISYMGISDVAGNPTSSTTLPASNLANNSDIVIDTSVADAPSLVQFMTDPVNLSNRSNVTLRVEGETNTTIYYSIDDNNAGTAAIVGNIAMDSDGSTDITGLNLTSLSDGTLTAQVQLKKSNGLFGGFSQDTVVKDTVSPTWYMQYYTDASFSTSLGNNPRLSAGTYYIRVTFEPSSEAMSSTVAPVLSINSEGTANDVSLMPVERVSPTTYRFQRTITYDASATGLVAEDLIMNSMTDSNGNSANNVNPYYESLRAAYTDTTKPTVTGTVTPNYAKAGTVAVALTFSAAMKTTVAPTVNLRKSNGQFLSVSGSFTNSTTWTGSTEIFAGESNGPADLQVSLAQDLAANVMNANESVFAFYIDTLSPSVSVNLGTDEGPVKTDTINLTAIDTGSGVQTRTYGFSTDYTCNASDTLTTAFSDGTSFNIIGNNTNYLCAKVADKAGNIAYQLIGKLNVDNTLPTIFSVTSDTTNGSYKAGATVEVRVNFTEAVTSIGNVTVLLETGTTDRSCTFSVYQQNYGICNYVVQTGDTTSDLNQISISGTINDLASNTLTNYTPTTGLAANKNIIIDTLAPVINIISPLQGNSSNSSTVVFFSNSEPTLSQCSFDGATWSGCASGSTSLGSITGWNSLPQGGVTLYVRDTDLAGNIGTDTESGIVKDTNFPVVSDVTSDKLSGYYKAGTTIPIIVTFSREVTSTGNVIVTLETGSVDRSCTFSLTNSTEGRCNYIVQDGDNSDDLTVSNISGTIKDSVGNALSSPIPVVNLADNKDIRIDTFQPIINTINSTHSNGTFGVGETIDIVVGFSEIVSSTGNITINLSSGGTCSLAVTNADSGTCIYTVLAGENTLDLTTMGITGTIADRAGNTLTNYTPTTNLGALKNIKIDTTSTGGPTIVSVISDKNNGAYTIGAEIPVTVNFSESALSVGLVTVTFETGTIDRNCQFSLNNATSGSCTYTVRENDTSPDLSVIAVTGTIVDVVNDPLINTVPAINLSNLKDIVIDTTAPVSPSVTLTDPINDINKTSVTITGTGEANATINYSINDTNSLTDAKIGTGTASGAGVISMTGIDLTGLDGGMLTASVTLTDSAGNVGSAGMDTATSQVLLPVITSITSNKSDGQYPLGEHIDIRVLFSENVTSQGDVTVLLETGNIDRSCSFTLDNSNLGICDYVVQAGDVSTDLNVKFIAGTIYDQADNPMVSFGISSNLAANKNISIDTVAPSAPSITLLDPINDTNKSNATITGTGEAGTTINYTINDGNDATAQKTGTGNVASDGVINLTGIDLAGLDGGVLTASVTLADSAGNTSPVGTDTASSQIILPTISAITSDKADGSYREGDSIGISLNFSEPVTSDGEVTVTLETGTNDRTCSFSLSSSSVGTCQYVVQAGDASDDLDVSAVAGTIYDQAGNPMIRFTTTTTLASAKNIIIDTTTVALNSFSSSTADGIYGPDAVIALSAQYSETIRDDSTITLELNTGATVTLSSISEGTKLFGTYRVGAPGSGEGTTDLSVSTIVSQNVCDLAGNCLTSGAVPIINVSTNSNIVVDAVSPIISEVFPENSTNVKNITDDSEIFYTLSEDMAEGSIRFVRTAWAEDPGSPHVCQLSGEYLLAGRHEKFDVNNCVAGSFSLTSGTVYSVSFNGKDALGNPAREVLKTGISYGLDTEAPIISDVTFDEITSTSAVIRWNTDEVSNSLIDFGPTTAYGETRGNSLVSLTEHQVDLTGLAPGTTYKVRVRSADVAGNQAVEDNAGGGYILMTLSLPVISNVEANEITYEGAKISWQSDENIYAYLRYGETTAYGQFAGDETILTDSQNISLSGLKSDTTYHYRVYFRDTFGNASFSEDFSFTTIIDPTDHSLPIISDIVVSEITKTSAKITWTTDESADSFVEYGTTDAYGEQFGNTVSTKTHVITLPNTLLAGTLYHFKVTSSDANGNKGVSADGTFTTTGVAGSGGSGSGAGEGTGGTVSPANLTLSGIKKSNITSSSVLISWQTSAPSNGMVSYGLSTKYDLAAGEGLTIDSVSNFKQDHSILISGLLSNTTYHYRAISYDSVGNIFMSGDESFSTLALSAISGVSVTNITLESATITWETGNPTTSEVSYGTTTGYGKKATDATVTNSHKIELVGLETGKTYHFRVEGLSKNVGAVSSDDYIFATYPEPKVDKQEVKTVTDSDAVISWVTNVPTESSVDYMNMADPKDNGMQGATDVVNNHEVKIIGLKQGTEYEIKVRGTDINKNAFESEPIRIKTSIDLTPPEISRISSKASLANQKDDIIQAIISWKTDEPATSQILFDIGMGNEDLGQQSKQDPNLTRNHVVVLTDLRPGTVYRFKAISEDANANVRQSDVFSVLTPRKEKSVFQLIITNFEQTFGWMKKMQ